MKFIVTPETSTSHEVEIKQLKVKSLKTFLSYEHDSNVPLIEIIKDYHSKDAERPLRHD